MYIISEKINGMFKNIQSSIKNRDENIIREVVSLQIKCGVNALDINVGPDSQNPLLDMEWLVKTVRKFTNLPLSIDTTKFEVMEVGLMSAGDSEGNIINSINADEEKIDRYISLIKKYKTKVIALLMDSHGIQRDVEKRIEFAAKIISKLNEAGIENKDIFIDPVLLPVNVMQDDLKNVLETIRQLQFLTSPPINTILGLSNIAQNIKNGKIIKRTFLVMAINAGLNSAILNPEDIELMNSIKTSEIITGQTIYYDDFIVNV